MDETISSFCDNSDTDHPGCTCSPPFRFFFIKKSEKEGEPFLSPAGKEREMNNMPPLGGYNNPAHEASESGTDQGDRLKTRTRRSQQHRWWQILFKG